MDNAVNTAINGLLDYAVRGGLIEARDLHFYANALIDIVGADAFGRVKSDTAMPETAAPLLNALADYMTAQGRCAGTAEARELNDARLMGALTPPPAAVRARFEGILASEGAQAATDWFYALCRANNYIRVDDIARNIFFQSPSRYGALDITINLSKPEKDPRQIAAERSAPPSGYPLCMLCRENEGYAGREALDGVRRGHPARQNLRVIPVELSDETWFMQYSPYLYYEEHCIVLAPEHRPMRMTRATFERMLAFVDLFPHYFIGSNAGLPIVGGSILSHDHFQGGRAELPMMRAAQTVRLRHERFPDVEAGVLDWPMTTLRLSSVDARALIDLCCHILEHWRSYSDPSAHILAETDAPHNAVTPIARKLDGRYVMDVALRNNRTSSEHPLGIFHPHADLHNIKRENIGLIEVMGLFILPGRLKDELAAVEAHLLSGAPLTGEAQKHAAFAQNIRARGDIMGHGGGGHAEDGASLNCENGRAGDGITRENVQALVRAALTGTCARVLEDAGVFKSDARGVAARAAYLRDAGFETVSE